MFTRKNKKDNKVNCEVVTKEVSMRRSSGNSMNPKSFQSQVTGKKRMADEKQHFDDVSTRLDFYYAELAQTPLVEKEDDVEDVEDVDIGDEMNKQVPLEDLSPTKAKLNYD